MPKINCCCFHKLQEKWHKWYKTGTDWKHCKPLLGVHESLLWNNKYIQWLNPKVLKEMLNTSTSCSEYWRNETKTLCNVGNALWVVFVIKSLFYAIATFWFLRSACSPPVKVLATHHYCTWFYRENYSSSGLPCTKNLIKMIRRWVALMSIIHFLYWLSVVSKFCQTFKQHCRVFDLTSLSIWRIQSRIFQEQWSGK